MEGLVIVMIMTVATTTAMDGCCLLYTSDAADE